MTGEFIQKIRDKLAHGNPSRVGHLDIDIDDIDRGCYKDPSCDRVTIDLGSEKLKIYCYYGNKTVESRAFQGYPDKKCPFEGKKAACMGLMFVEFANTIAAHDRTHRRPNPSGGNGP
jgi:hypothetical protein